jgi:spore germination protein KA
MGDAAVSAGIVGAPIVITIAITAVAGFSYSNAVNSVSIQRLVIMGISWIQRIFRHGDGPFGILIHLSTLTSFGVPYFDGFAWTRNLEDSIIRMPLWTMVKRPKHVAKSDVTRRRFFIPPLRP